MKVKMLKTHMDYKKGSVVEVRDDMARYWIGCNVAVKHEKGKKAKKKFNEDKSLKIEGEVK